MGNIPLEYGKVYLLIEDDFYGEPRSIVARFEGIKEEEEHDIQHLFTVSDGRKAFIRLEYWVVEEGSELLWALG